MKRLIPLGILGLLFSLGCRPQSPSSHLQGDDTVSELGQGQNDITAQRLPSCLKFTALPDTAPNSGSHILKLVEGRNQLAAYLGVHEEELGAGTEGNPVAQWIAQIHFEPRIAHVLLQIKRVGRVQSLNPSKVGLKADFRDDYQKSYANFVANCGDSFVNRIEFGDALYAVIPVVIESLEQKDDLTKKVDAAVNPAALVALLDRYATRPVHTLSRTQGQGLKQVPYNDFKVMLSTYQDSPIQNIKVGRDTWSYQLLKAEPEATVVMPPDPLQIKRLNYVEAFRTLARSTTDVEECRSSADVMENRPVEYKALANFAQLRADIDAAADDLSETLGTCRQEECTQGVCEPVTCRPKTDQTAKGAACSSIGKALLPTDAFIYRYVLEHPNIGLMTALSTKGDQHAMQSIGQEILVHGQPETSQTVVSFREPVYRRWTSAGMIDKLGMPQAQPRSLLNTAEVQKFDRGNLIHLQPQTSSTVYFINYLTDFLGDNLPNGDEQSVVENQLSFTKIRAAVDTLGGSTYFYYGVYMLGIKLQESTAHLWNPGALGTFWRNKGGISWAVAVESEKLEPGDVWTFRASDGNYYWWSSGRWPARLGVPLSNYYRSIGGAAGVYGRVQGDETCDANNCWATFDGGVLTVSLAGARVCPAGQHAADSGSCTPDSCGSYDGLERFTGDTWTFDITNGRINKSCDSERVVHKALDCNKGYADTDSNFTCNPAPCGTTPSGQTYISFIVGGQQTWLCSLGQSLYKSVSCSSGYRRKDRLCELIPPRCEGRDRICNRDDL